MLYKGIAIWESSSMYLPYNLHQQIHVTKMFAIQVYLAIASYVHSKNQTWFCWKIRYLHPLSIDLVASQWTQHTSDIYRILIVALFFPYLPRRFDHQKTSEENLKTSMMCITFPYVPICSHIFPWFLKVFSSSPDASRLSSGFEAHDISRSSSQLGDTYMCRGYKRTMSWWAWLIDISPGWWWVWWKCL